MLGTLTAGPDPVNAAGFMVLIAVCLLFAVSVGYAYVKVWLRRLRGVTGWATVVQRRDRYEDDLVIHHAEVRIDGGPTVHLRLDDRREVPVAGDRILVRYDRRDPANVGEVRRTPGAYLIAAAAEVIMVFFTVGSLGTVLFLIAAMLGR
ncbi:hypothetical protein ACFQZ4_04250 [Catellatospora coxensis]|uniref:hypothetical protein n=1 Tax=Catellatospora coxensis TaxID=310354 RepID=UPI001944FB69|nr:hypothetical protein [Catellatospora coxensis]